MRSEKPNTYRVMEIFYSLQGEGGRAGSANVFIRFAGCNLDCVVAKHGFDCDTDWKGGTAMTAREISKEVRALMPGIYPKVIFTGGEPTLQLDHELWRALSAELGEFHSAVETNGTRPVPTWVDYIACCPKRNEPIVLHEADELRVVVDAETTLTELKEARAAVAVPKSRLFLSPAFISDTDVDKLHLDRVIGLVLGLQDWRLSVQQHKTWGVR